jgi:hypothetical protein
MDRLQAIKEYPESGQNPLSDNSLHAFADASQPVQKTGM